MLSIALSKKNFTYLFWSRPQPRNKFLLEDIPSGYVFDFDVYEGSTGQKSALVEKFGLCE